MRRARTLVAGAVTALILATAASVLGSHLGSDTEGHTTLQTIVTGDNPDLGYARLRTELVNSPYVVRDGTAEGDSAIPDAQAGRDQRRRSLAYFGQLTDFQLADEESTARVEFLDPGPSSAWRPQEALQPFIIDWSIRQMNLFAGSSPVTQGDGTRAAMDFSLMTGDQADSAQRNETIWVRELLEGGTPLNFNSGSTNPNDYDPTAHPSCAGYPPSSAHRAEALRYTGVQDYSDYDESQTPLYYSPDEPRGSWAQKGFPTYTGLMDRAQQLVITPEGTAVPSYVTNGNHDPLVQGNEDPNAAFEDIAMGCSKMLASTATPGPGVLDPSVLLAPAAASTLVPPDPMRRYVSKPQIKAIYGENGVDNAHGYGWVDDTEDSASNGSASYYAWNPVEAPGFRFINIDTVSEGGQTAEGVGAGSSSGNIDDPQFQWLKRELDAATASNKLVVIWGHHPVRSMDTEVADEQASQCTTQDSHGDVPEHDRNPGCDLDPRLSTPIHLGQDPAPGDPRESFVELLDRYPHVLAYVAGHTHDNNVQPFTRTGGGVWWGIETAATADWPVQHRLIEVMDNEDGTLSLFGTLLDHAAAAAAPLPGNASAFNSAQLASIGRELAYNDPQHGDGTGEGTEEDQNVELLVRDPRRGYPRPQAGVNFRVPFAIAYQQCVPGGGNNRTHGPALTAPSCNPASQTSATATVGTLDANGQLPKSVGYARFRVMCNPPAPNPTLPCSDSGDQADVGVKVQTTDIRTKGTLVDFDGTLTLKTGVRITDKHNSSPTTGVTTDPATATDLPITVPVPCTPTADNTVGSTCEVDTTLDTVTPGTVPEGARSNWELSRVDLLDQATIFETQGIFIP